MGIMLWCTTAYYPRYEKESGNSAFGWDAGGYYWYLPSLFIYHDLADQAWADSMLRKYDFGPRGAEGQGFRAPNGKVVMKYPCGMALLEAPFFAAGHVLAGIRHDPQDGFSRPYQAAVQIGGLLVAFIGLWGLRRFLKAYFPDGIVAAILLILVVGTNYLNYSTTDNTVAHSWLFTLYVLLLLATRSFYASPRRSSAAAIGLLCGLAALLRPTDAIACLIPLLWGLESLRRPALQAQLRLLWKERGKLILAILCAAALVSLQLIYWKSVSGQWIVYSYQDQGFSFLRPHVFDYTFSYRSGWVTYTPVVLLALAGIVPFWRRGPNRVMVFAFLGLAYYLVTAWDIWWYAGMGGRAMVQYYPVLSILMAAGLQWLWARRGLRIAAVPLILLLCSVNIWFMYQAHAGHLYDAEGGMTKEYYWRVIGRKDAPPEVAKLKDGKYLFEGPLPSEARLLFRNSLHQALPGGGDSMLILDGATRESAYYSFAKPPGRLRWIRAKARFHSITGEPVIWNMLQFCIGVTKGGDRKRETMMRVQRFVRPGESRELWVDLKPPSDGDYDSIAVHFWNVESSAETRVDELEVWGW